MLSAVHAFIAAKSPGELSISTPKFFNFLNK